MLIYLLESRRPSLVWRVLVCLDAVAWPVGGLLVIAAFAGEVPLFLLFGCAMWTLMRLRRALFRSTEYQATSSKALALILFLCALFVLMKMAVV